jgi:chromosome segregation ATPase
MNIDPSTTEGAIKFGGGVVAALAGVITLWSKLTRSMAADRVERVSSDAQADVVDGLREELLRLRAHNAELATELNSAQLLAARLQAELGKMAAEVASLQDQISRLIAKSAAQDSRY